MPAKIDPGDWDRLFAPNAPRRGGPLRVLGNLLIIAIVFGIASGGALFAIAQRDRQIAVSIATATAFTATNIPLQTAAAVAETATVESRQVSSTATAVAQATATTILGIGAVNRGGNLRSEPIVAPETIVGLIWPGDQIEFLAQRDIDGQSWYFIRVTRLAPNRDGEGVPQGSEGWASASLLSPVAPAP